MNFNTWLDGLNNLGVFAPLDALRAHIDAAPSCETADEVETVRIAEKVWSTRSSGGDIYSVI